MKLTIDTSAKTAVFGDGDDRRELDLFSKESFDLIAKLWVEVGWVRKYSYTFSWMGRPIIQLPEDMIRTQEAVWEIKPDVIIETGVAHGGSLILYTSLCAAMGRGRVVGVDVEIRPHNRQAIEAHPLFERITLIEGDSVAAATVDRVKALIEPSESVMVILDSNHSKAHVAAELAAYAGLVTPGSYLLVADGIMEQVAGMPRTEEDWSWNNPKTAVSEFLRERDDFVLVDPPRPFDESMEIPDCTYHPAGWLRRK